MRYLLLATTLFVTPVYADWQCKDQAIGISKRDTGQLDVMNIKTDPNKLSTLRVTLKDYHLKTCSHVGCWAGEVVVTQATSLVHAYGILTWDNPKDTGSAHYQLSIDTKHGLGVLLGEDITPLLCKKLP